MIDEEYIPIIERIAKIEMYLATPPAMTHTKAAYDTTNIHKMKIIYLNGS